MVRAVVYAAMSGRNSRSCSGRRSTRPYSGWPIHSGWPTISANAANCALPLVAKPTQPSLVGSTDGTSTTHEIGSGSGPRPSICDATACIWSNTSVAASSTDTSTKAPSPARRTPCSTARAATPATAPAAHSPRRPPTDTGGPWRRPRLPVDPAQPWMVNSLAGRSAHGPSEPNHEMPMMPRPGCSARTAASSRPSAASSARRSPPTTRSARATSAPSSATSSGFAGSTSTLRADACRWSNNASSTRAGSPPGGSIFTTSAPASASSFVQ